MGLTPNPPSMNIHQYSYSCWSILKISENILCIDTASGAVLTHSHAPGSRRSRLYEGCHADHDDDHDGDHDGDYYGRVGDHDDDHYGHNGDHDGHEGQDDHGYNHDDIHDGHLYYD